MTDVLLFQTPEGGDVEMIGGALTSTDGFETACYLSLFGGNEEDSGRTEDDLKQWWGNFTMELDAETERQRSETQNLLRSRPLTSALVRDLELAVERDLAWMIADGYARSISVAVSIPQRNRVRIVAEVSSDDGVRRAEFIAASSF